MTTKTQTNRPKRASLPSGRNAPEVRPVLSTTMPVEPALVAEASTAQTFAPLPISTTRAVNHVLTQIDRTFTRATANSGAVPRLQTERPIASSQLPHGSAEVLPLWLDAVHQVYDRPSLGEAYQMVRAEPADSTRLGVESGLFILR